MCELKLFHYLNSLIRRIFVSLVLNGPPAFGFQSNFPHDYCVCVCVCVCVWGGGGQLCVFL